MLIVIPIAAYGMIFLYLRRRFTQASTRQLVLRSALLWGAYLVLSTELLSLVRGVTPVGLALGWLLPILLVAWRWRVGGYQKIPTLRMTLPRHWLDWVLLVGLLVILSITALVAWVTPPQTWDSLNYHMPRVAHWAQGGGVHHFATGIEVQNSMPPGAEMVALHFYVLGGSDRLVNFVAWLAMLGYIIGCSLIAKQLGASGLGQWLSTIVAATIPMGIVQASSTMTDGVVAFWVICVASEVLSLYSDESVLPAVIFANLGAGLALLSKPIAVAYLLPLVVLANILLARRVRLRRLIIVAGLSLSLVLALNAGHLVRNTITYGNPISRQERIDKHANQLMTVPGMLSNVLRNAGLHLGTPKAAVNEWIFAQVLKIHEWLDVDINDPRTTLHGEYRPIGGFATHEDVVGNLLHAVLIAITFCVVLLGGKHLGRMAVVYMFIVVTAFFLFSLLFKWQIFGTRYHQSFFVLFAPLIGLITARFLPANASRLMGGVMILSCSLWLFAINSRPLIPQDRSYTASILIAPRQELYFANGNHLLEPYTELTSRVNSAPCSRVGIMLSGQAAEYPLWVLLGAPRPDLEIEWLVSGTASVRYEQADFQPCAVICQDCPEDWDDVRGLPLASAFGSYKLYLAPNP